MRGSRKRCSCGRMHWSLTSERCPFCRHTDHAKEVMRYGPRSERKSTPQQPRLVDDVRRAKAHVWTRRGRCLDHPNSCYLHWRHLDHRHCSCGRAMAARAEICGACLALELMGAQLALVHDVDDRPWRDVVDPSEVYLDDMVATSAAARSGS